MLSRKATNTTLFKLLICLFLPRWVPNRLSFHCNRRSVGTVTCDRSRDFVFRVFGEVLTITAESVLEFGLGLLTLHAI